MYGAGNIGRGFIGQVLRDCGYRVVFVDINTEMVSALNKAGRYTQVIVDGNTTTTRVIDEVSAVDGKDLSAVAKEIADCDLMAVSVGTAVLPFIAPNIAAGIAERMRTTGLPLNILLCENALHAHELMGNLLRSVPGFDPECLKRVGLVRTTIGRMVPVLSSQAQREDPTRIAVESFCELPVDKDAFVGEMPFINCAVPYSPFSFYEDKKLYIHNMGHAMTAYLGYLKGYEYIWQAVADEDIFSRTRSAMLCVVKALAAEYGAELAGLISHADELLARFGNRGLGDTIARVGRDPMRKLAHGDRFAGAVSKCSKNGVACEPILEGIAASLLYQGEEGDPSAAEMLERIQHLGPVGFLKNWCRLSEADSEKCSAIFDIYSKKN